MTHRMSIEKEFKNESSIIMLGLLSEFPGLLNGEEVNGSDLTQFLTVCVFRMSKEAKEFAEICTDPMGKTK